MNISDNLLFETQDLSSLSNLIKLEYLNLISNDLEDISVLAELKNLTELHLSYNQIFNLTSISYLSKLQIISIIENEITDISPLAFLHSLEEGLFIPNDSLIRDREHCPYGDEISNIISNFCYKFLE